MKTSQWIKDVKTVIGCEVPELFYVLAKIANEDNDRGLFARKCESKILECITDVKLFLGEIRRNAQDFTLHDIQHCINVIDFMGQMLVDIDKLNPAEISFFIYSALLHDIGMVKLPEEDTELDDIREDHGDRSAKFIRERIISTDNGKWLDFGEWDDVYVEYLPSICASHMQEFSFVEKLPQSYILDEMEVDISLCAILLRLADAMDLKRNRAPYQLYQFLFNKSVSQDHWKKHMSISNCQINERGVYRVDGICHDEASHRCLYNHLDMIESEIEKIFKWKNGLHPGLKLRSHIVERNIKTNSYKMWHHSFSMDILKITNLFMGEQLYGDKKLGLREIVQNSIDACMVRDEMNKKLGAKQDYTYKPEISIIFDKDNNQVIIRDNGTGMNDYIIENYFLNIGVSYYSSREFKKLNLKYSPSGYFGIGFLACFMLSDDVYVRTSHWQKKMEYEFHFIKNDKFVTKTESPHSFLGTEIRLNLKQFVRVFGKYSSESLESIDSVVDKVVDFLHHTFWDLEINRINCNVLLCSIQTNSFLEYAKEINKDECNYNIDLSEYLKDFEGLIQLDNSELFETMECIGRISKKNPLDALRKGEINISNEIKEVLPFIKQFYTYIEEEKRISIITDNNINYYNTIILFPTRESIIDEKQLWNKDIKRIINDYQNNLNAWNCLCLRTFLRNESINISLYIDTNKSFLNGHYDFNIETFYNCLGYEPTLFIRIDGVNDYVFSKISIYDNAWSYTKTSFWLKHAIIALSNFNNQNITFVYFKIQSITMRIFNSLIIWDSSRKFIVDSSTDILKRAIYICIYLWIYDQIKAEKDAIKSTEYLRQLILKEWDDSVDGLLRPEKKPI